MKSAGLHSIKKMEKNVCVRASSARQQIQAASTHNFLHGDHLVIQAPVQYAFSSDESDLEPNLLKCA